MQYTKVIFAYDFAEEWQKDLFEQALADIGFDSFDGETAYIPSELFDEAVLREVVRAHAGVQLLEIEACEDRNWNETWEAEHPITELPSGIRIMPHCAFGAGYHETTGMMIDRFAVGIQTGLRPDRVQNTDQFSGRWERVLDNGCGTGVLGIMAARCGAKAVIMVDIDDKSVTNTRENIELNRELVAGTEFTVLQGDTPPEGKYDLILSNIHRNILLQQMPLYAAYLNPGGEVWLSGFYEADCPALLAAAEKAGLKIKDKKQRGDWILLVLNGND